MKKCAIKDYIFFENQKTFFNNLESNFKESKDIPELEISKEGDIIPHLKNRCYIADMRISNIFFEEKVINSHFKLFYQYIIKNQKKYTSFPNGCYNCIFKEKIFNYKNL